jgi:Holliday junction resolvase RusA-like endonuclease
MLALSAWRDRIAAAVREVRGADALPLTGPVAVALAFDLARPRGHYGTGRNADTLRASAPVAPTRAPDIDKLTRAVLDALTGPLYVDDGQVVALVIAKHYGSPQGCAVGWEDIDGAE